MHADADRTRLNLQHGRGRRTGRGIADDDRGESRCARLARLLAPEQDLRRPHVVAAGNLGHRRARRERLGKNRRLGLRSSTPTALDARDDLHPARR